MKLFRITIKPTSALGTPLQGDTLFGQFCWGVVHHLGEEKLTQLLEGYTENKPFIIFSDAFPVGCLPLPTLPSTFFLEMDVDRKQLKKLQWIKTENTQFPTEHWKQKAWEYRNEFKLSVTQNQMHNSIDRLEGSTTVGDQFAPYQSFQTWFKNECLFDFYIVLDEQRLSLQNVECIINNIGKFGFGRDATIGLGKFDIVSIKEIKFYKPDNANSYMTLSNASPQNKNFWDKEHCYYQITTRFGRHGDKYALDENPFKKPIILTKAGAVFTPKKMKDILFIGRGLNNVSFISPEIVHQGYAPVIPIRINFDQQ